jgi:hypothetical protein
VKLPTEVLALGARIVRELELEPGVDTLGRWLSHHLAEVMLAAQNAAGTAEREVAQQKAVDLILKVWSRRHDLPGRASPLKELEKVTAVLTLLRSQPWPHSVSAKGGVAQLLRRAFDGLRHVLAHGVLITTSTVGKPVDVGEAENFVDADEALVIAELNAWIKLYDSTQESLRVRLAWEEDADLEAMRSELEELLKLEPDVQARVMFARQVDRLIEVLQKLKTSLGSDGVATRSPMADPTDDSGSDVDP